MVGTGLSSQHVEDGPGLCPGASGDRSRPLPALASPRPLPWPRPHREPGAQLSVPVLLCPRHLGLASPLTPSFQTGPSSCPPQGGKPPPHLRHPKKARVQTCGAGGGFTRRGRTRRSQTWLTVAPGTAGGGRGSPAAQASPPTSGCFCRRCLSSVARRPKGTQQWGHSKRGPPGPRPCMRRWRLSLLLWAQA